MSDTDLPVNDCACHEWHPVAEVGNWIHELTGTKPVTYWAAQPDLWEKSNLSHEDLRGRIQQAAGIGCADALTAKRLPSGEVRLTDGVHRWTVAVELGISAVPVEMRDYDPEASVWAWVP